jgi:hypothetical protein
VGANATQTITLAVGRKSGDVNLDGAIDAADIAQVKTAFGSALATVDLNNDGRVDIFDLVLVKQHFGN